MTTDWLERWEVGRTGWHEAGGNRNLQTYWQARDQRVLVPLCGASPDLLWLEERGNSVVGVELSPLAAERFFKDHALEYERADGSLPVFRATERRIEIVCGDYFEFDATGFTACYDRGSLIALPADVRPAYVEHTRARLANDADYLLISVEYDQTAVDGPPFSVGSDEIAAYLPELTRVAAVDDLENCPPKFRDAGLAAFDEVVWQGRLDSGK